VTKHLFSGLRLTVGGIVAAGLIAASAGPVAADTTPPGDASYSQNGGSAELSASDCSTDGDITTCSDEQIYVFAGKMTDSVTGVTHASQVCAALSSYSYSETDGTYVGTPSFEQGCRVDLPTGSIKIDSKLNSAALAPTTVHVEDGACEKFGCDPGAGRDIVAVATWTGFGPTQSTKYRGSFGDGTCRSHESSKGLSRSAEIDGSLGGQPLGSDRFGGIFSGKFTFRSSCSEV
jgi:hypothetical protein